MLLTCSLNKGRTTCSFAQDYSNYLPFSLHPFLQLQQLPFLQLLQLLICILLPSVSLTFDTPPPSLRMDIMRMNIENANLGKKTRELVQLQRFCQEICQLGLCPNVHELYNTSLHFISYIVAIYLYVFFTLMEHCISAYMNCC